jgi:hypothetical protein
MTILEQIHRRLTQLPPEKQQEVLDFAIFLQQYTTSSPPLAAKTRSLRNHAAFGSWKKRNINPLSYEQTLRAEWDPRP